MAETCPKCGYPQVETDECPRCRVVVSQYRAYLQRLGRPPAKPTAPVIAPPAPPPSPGVAPPPPVEAGIWPEGSPAGFWVRAAALVVDGLTLGAVLLPFVVFIMLPTLLAGGISRPDPAYFMAVFGGYVIVALAVQWGYTVWMHGKWGQTLGKMATGVKVVKVNSELIGYGRAIVRYLFPFLVGYTPSLSSLLGTPRIIQILLSIFSFVLGVVNYLTAGFRSDKRALHDLVAGTRVMKVRRPRLEGKPSGFWMRFAAAAVDWSFLSLVLGVPFWIVAVIGGVVTTAIGRGRESTLAAVFLTFGLFLFAFTIVYNIWMHGRWGQTLGKRALGMKVVRVDGSPVGYGRAILRWIVAVLPPLLLVFIILMSVVSLVLTGPFWVAGTIVSAVVAMMGYIVAGLRSDKRSLHDLVAGSRVTYIR
jgi:uncharacterized RDD family membrane protein YckC